MDSDQKNSKTSFRAEREFGLIVGSIAILVGGWWLYRGKWEIAAQFFMGLGSLLVLLGLLFPKVLVLPNQGWMGLAKIISLVTTPIILGVIYFLLMMPIGIIKRLFGWDP